MNSKTKSKIIEACRKQNIQVAFCKISKGEEVRLYQKGIWNSVEQIYGRIVGNKILQLNCHLACEQKTFNKVFNIINQINE